MSGQGLLPARGNTLCRSETVPSKGRSLTGSHLREECCLRSLVMKKHSVYEERQGLLGTELGEEVTGRGVDRVKLLAVGCVLRGGLQICAEQHD